MSTVNRPAPAWQIDQWFNTPTALTLESLRGKVIALESFQMLCPGCVSHGLPQAMRIRATFAAEDVAVIGLHTVFEHHAAMTPTSLQAFLHEYRIHFPVGVDRAGIDGAATPRTMSAYFMQGTPTLTLIDATGVIRYQYFGQVSDMQLGAQVMELVQEANAQRNAASAKLNAQQSALKIEGCEEQGCAI